jgi:phospholipase/lecithinase/hemolysin
MRQFKLLSAALAAALLVVACGGGGDGNQAPAVSYRAVVSFGDSLTDAGTYNVPSLGAAGAHGLFTINGVAGALGSDPTPSYTWAQLVSASAVGSVNCAARVGGFGVPVAAVSGCTNYAEGGSRVSQTAGVGYKADGSAALTMPVTTQIANYFADGHTFSGTDLVTVLAGANDLFAATAQLQVGATAAGGQALATSLVTQLVALAPAANQAAAATAIGTAVATAAAASGATATSIISAAITAAATHAATNGYTTTAVANAATIGATAGAAATAAGNTYAATTGAQIAGASMVQAASELVAAVKAQIIAKGATHVVVVNLPNVARTPMALATVVYNADGTVKDNSQQKLVAALTQAFNDTLAAGLSGVKEALLVDAFAENTRQMDNPAHYALTNVTNVACNLGYGKNIFATLGNLDGSSLVCNTGNLVSGDTSHYMFADNVHPTPYEHKLLAQYVNKALILAGWL